MSMNTPEMPRLVWGGASTQLVEDVVRALWSADRYHPGPLQQVGRDGGSCHPSPSIKGDLCELAKA